MKKGRGHWGAKRTEFVRGCRATIALIWLFMLIERRSGGGETETGKRVRERRRGGGESSVGYRIELEGREG